MATNRERLRLYIIPNLTRAGDIALGGIRVRCCATCRISGGHILESRREVA
jgi:hypothetical protein